MKQNGTPREREPDDVLDVEETADFDPAGEFISFPEQLVVSPLQGRFRREPIVEGSVIAAGTVIGSISFNGGTTLPVTTKVGGIFLGWFAWEGESLQRGALLARIGRVANGSNGEAHDRA
ncbi:MAG: hypothetical protein ACRDKG_05315 [Actinomycetota bacterium]